MPVHVELLLVPLEGADEVLYVLLGLLGFRFELGLRDQVLQRHDPRFLVLGAILALLDVQRTRLLVDLPLDYGTHRQVPALVLCESVHLGVEGGELGLRGGDDVGLAGFAVDILQVLTLVLIMQVSELIPR